MRLEQQILANLIENEDYVRQSIAHLRASYFLEFLKKFLGKNISPSNLFCCYIPICKSQKRKNNVYISYIHQDVFFISSIASCISLFALSYDNSANGLNTEKTKPALMRP